jgi:protein-S-isoprenylcysteine O-methyltransferase Ste14
MSISDRIVAWLPLASLLVIFLLARVRALMLRRRGVSRVVVDDWQRPWREILYDLFAFAVAMFWIYLLIARAWPFSLQWLPGPLPDKLVDSFAARCAGVLLVVIAPLLFVAALRSFGVSWRIGVDRQSPGPLVTSGVFGWTRNPIYLAFYLLMLGSFLIHGRVVFGLTAAILALMIHGVVLREERFLISRHGEDFRNYCRRVGRYCPWF